MILQEAIDALPPGEGPVTLKVPPGVYREKLRIDRPGVRLVGRDPHTTVITWDDHALKTFPDGRRYGTFASATVLVTGRDFRAEGITFENTAGPGHLVGQALAAYVDADRAVFRNCRFLGHQDTLFTGPLPPFPLTAVTFGGPREDAPRLPTRQYYADCYFAGDVDFVFGSATAVFQRCELFSRDRGEPTNGWITAASTPEGAHHGYVFLDCRLTGNAAPGSVYLGRPWRDFAQTLFVRCELGPHIHRDGWHDWDKPHAHHSVVYGEVGCHGPGATGSRPEWVTTLSADEIARLTVPGVLGGIDGWNPEAP